ncbi:hypothetical protein VIN01S_29530 [Vibrio inusitatus NBRC 102082]|uniref:Uncharacterized protein n=1 Tax=Vibrio inusitatus NBRC 102082 TaxID=1219070 RepID=A0A4Y3HY95_9VIBR|nr:hypothetical protein [Vibrio inusitatus]GEA52149.1 hypothetical protein VIN01S_29530 [Vibrio inusitatus NBRC 102082]
MKKIFINALILSTITISSVSLARSGSTTTGPIVDCKIGLDVAKTTRVLCEHADRNAK